MIKDANLTVDGLKIVGQLNLPENREPPYPAIILCHGIPSGVVDPNDGGYPLLAGHFSARGFAVYTFRFRGTGESEGNFDIAGWTHDLEAAVDYIWEMPEIDDAYIILLGFSAGAAVSIYVAAHDKRIAAVAACASPADFKAISDPDKLQMTLNYFRKIGIIRDPEYPDNLREWLNNFRKINPLHSIASISPRPLLLVHSAGDNVVPVNNSQRLYEQAGEPKKLVVIEGSEHRLRLNSTAMDTVLKWLNEQVFSH